MSLFCGAMGSSVYGEFGVDVDLFVASMDIEEYLRIVVCREADLWEEVNVTCERAKAATPGDSSGSGGTGGGGGGFRGP
jgi:hypothetical protein